MPVNIGGNIVVGRKRGVQMGGGGCAPYYRIDGTVATGAAYNHPADGVIEFTLTTKAGSGGTRMMFRRQSSGNLWYLTCHSDGNLYLSKNVAGTLTQVASSTGGSADGAHIEILFVGQSIQAFSNGALKLSYATASQFTTATGGKRNDGTDTGMGALVEGGTVSDLKSWTSCYSRYYLLSTAYLFKQSDFSASGLTTMRSTLIPLIWRTEGVMPSGGLSALQAGVADPLSSSASHLASVDKYTTSVGDATDRVNYVWHPTSPNGKLLIYHYGHTSEDWAAGGLQVEFINAAIDDGYTVCGSQMPPGSVTGHNLYPVPNGSLNPIKYFIEDVIRCINQLVGSFSAIYMAGLSGGSWTTVLCAALDTRITRNVHFTGDFPLFITESSRDYEQLLPGIYPAFDYTDLYVMASSSNRRQVQSGVVSGSGIFTQANYNVTPYADAVTYRVPSSGSYSLTWDSTTLVHEISAAARVAALAFFDAA